jgi:hypothetical protein
MGVATATLLTGITPLSRREAFTTNVTFPATKLRGVAAPILTPPAVASVFTTPLKDSMELVVAGNILKQMLASSAFAPENGVGVPPKLTTPGGSFSVAKNVPPVQAAPCDPLITDALLLS